MLVRFTARFSALHILLSALTVLAAVSQVAAQDQLTKLRAQYAAQTDPIDKARALAKLSLREMSAARDLVKDNEDEKALEALGHFRDEVVATTQALVGMGVDASRRSKGFKELQISLRMFISRLDDLILTLPQDERPLFRAVKADLDSSENTLIDALFPARPPKRPQEARPK